MGGGGEVRREIDWVELVKIFFRGSIINNENDNFENNCNLLYVGVI